MSDLQPLLKALPALATSVNPALGVAASVISTVSDSRNLEKQQAQQTRALQRQQAENLRSAQEDAALDKATIKAQAEAAENDRRDALKRAVARQRVNFGASGLTGDGSSQAVLLGLFDESNDDRQERERLDALRLGAIDKSIAQIQRGNLIARSGLADRQSVARAIEGDNFTASTLKNTARATDLL